MSSWKKVVTSGSDAELNALTVSTSVSASSYTGSLSYTNLINVPAGLVSSSTQINTGSFSGSITSASYALTSSYALLAGNAISASWAPAAEGTVVAWNSVTNKPAGLVSSSQQLDPFTGSLYSNNLQINSGVNSITITGSAKSGIFNATELIEPLIPADMFAGTTIEYTAQRTGAVRSGNIISSWSGSTITYTDVSNTDVGETWDLSFNLIRIDDNIRLRAYSLGSGSGNWTVQVLFKLFPNLL